MKASNFLWCLEASWSAVIKDIVLQNKNILIKKKLIMQSVSETVLLESALLAERWVTDTERQKRMWFLC